MPENNEQRAEFEAFAKMAADADKQGLDADSNIDLANYLAPSPAKTVPDTAKETKVASVEVPDEAKTKTEPERAEIETVEEGEAEEETEDTEETPEEELTPAERRLRKDQARLARNFQEFQQQKEESREELRRLREELAEVRGQQSTMPAEKDEQGYTAQQWQEQADRSAQEGDVKGYKISLQQAEGLRQKEAYAQFMAGWHKTQAEMLKENPDLGNIASPLAKEVVKLLDEPQSIFKTRPDGLKIAVAYAKSQLDTGSIPALKGEIKKLKQELTRLNELSSVPGDKPHRMSGMKPRSFDSMDAKDQLETLRRSAKELDDMRTSG